MSVILVLVFVILLLLFILVLDLAFKTNVIFKNGSNIVPIPEDIDTRIKQFAKQTRTKEDVAKRFLKVRKYNVSEATKLYEVISILEPGDLLLENPIKCSNLQGGTHFITRLRSIQARLFSVVTKSPIQHVISYVGNEQVIHTRNGKVRVDNIIDDFPIYFLESCSVLKANKKEIESATKKNWKTDLWPTIESALRKYTTNGTTDTIGIMLTPLKRWFWNKPDSSSETSFTCTSLVIEAWRRAGIELFTTMGPSCTYPSDFISLHYFSQI